MVTKLNNFTHKSFFGYTNPNDLLFRTKNILFGYNGKGKSSITTGIRYEFLKGETNKPDNLRIFDRDYISNSLLMENSDDIIKGVEASFGKGGVDIENKIVELEKLVVNTNKIGELDASSLKIRKEIRTSIDDIHNRRKGESNIQKKSKDESVERVIELYRKDYQDAKKIESEDDNLIKISGDNSIEKQISQIENLRPLTFFNISTALLEDVKSIFQYEFTGDVAIPEFEIVQWIESGLRIHREGDNCKFCDSKLDYSDIQLKLTQYKENKKHKAIEKLKQFRYQLLKLLDSIKLFQNESTLYSLNIGKFVEQNFEKINENLIKIDFLIGSCQSKIDKMEIRENFDFEQLLVSIGIFDKTTTAINKAKNDQLSELRRKLNNLTTLVKGAIGLEIVNSVIIKNKLDEVKVQEQNIKDWDESNNRIQAEIKDFKQQKSSTKDFADFVSKIFNDINVSLKVTLDSDNRNYVVRSTNENVKLTIKDISEGEKNLLALLFFYYELFEDNEQKKIKAEIELIVVDDPISSMDDSNKFYILELMKNLLDFSNIQIFVMTHSWDDYCCLSYGKKAWDDRRDKEGNVSTSQYATFEIRKSNGKSELVKANSLEKPYNYLFKEIYVFSKKSDQDLKSECQIYHYPNVMRRIFEEWYGFKIGREMNFTSNLQKQIEDHFGISSNTEKTKLGLLIKVCNILSHSINGSMNPQEIHQSSKYLMKLIERNDKLHYDHMKQ